MATNAQLAAQLQETVAGWQAVNENQLLWLTSTDETVQLVDPLGNNPPVTVFTYTQISDTYNAILGAGATQLQQLQDLVDQITPQVTAIEQYIVDFANYDTQLQGYVADALTYRNDAQSFSNSANNSATAASNSASAAGTSETNAAQSETNAGNSATAAATSETNAGNSETAAATSEFNAATSETNAANSETAAALSETNAGISETNAAASEAAAATSASNAANAASSQWKIKTASASPHRIRPDVVDGPTLTSDNRTFVQLQIFTPGSEIELGTSAVSGLEGREYRVFSFEVDPVLIKKSPAAGAANQVFIYSTFGEGEVELDAGQGKHARITHFRRDESGGNISDYYYVEGDISLPSP